MSIFSCYHKNAGTLKCKAAWLATLTLLGCVSYIAVNHSSRIASTIWTVGQELQPVLNENSYNSTKKVIFFGTDYWSDKLSWKKVFSRLLNRECPINDCSLSFEWNYASSADAIVYNAVNIISKMRLPPSRKQTQVLVYFSVEAPPILDTSAEGFNRMKDVFNWTMTYLDDSDVYMPYGQVLISEKSDHDNEPNPWQEKQKILRATPSRPLACWMVSHCLTASRREDYVHELQKYFPVDIYGKCGPLRCGARQTISTLGQKDNCQAITEQYHFYLSFENALCRDYVTEKFYKALDLNIVPVVFGSANYTAIAPPNSFIDALDFESPRQLASYLKLVAGNETKYNSFFDWKKHFSVQLGHPISPMVCDLCAKLHGSKSSVYHREVQQLSPLKRSHQGTHPPYTAHGMNGSRTLGGDPPLTSNQAFHYSDIKKWFVDDSNCQTWTLNGLISHKKNLDEQV